MIARLRQGNRRAFLGAALVGGLMPRGVWGAVSAAPLRFGTTPVFLDDQIGLLGHWQRYLENRLVRPVRFVQRGTYREIIDLLLDADLDAAWLCGFPFVVHADRMAVVAVPLYQGEPLYRSYLIVPSTDTATMHVSELRGRIFAYSDPNSNSGYLVPRVELIRAGQKPDGFFRRSFFTFGHRRVVEAVQSGLAHAGSVDGYVWDTLVAQQPKTVGGVRVAWRSPLYGFPPVVSRHSLAALERRSLQEALASMSRHPEGARLLAKLNIEGFAAPRPGLFDGIRSLASEHARYERQTA